MVRHKSRWFLVNITESEEVGAAQTVERKHLYHSLRSIIDSAFGIVGSGITDDIQVKYYNPKAHIAVVKVPRDKHKLIRAAFTLITEINDKPVLTSILSVNGSARTCKMAATRSIRRWFNVSHQGQKVTDSELRKLQVQMEEISRID